MHNGQDQVNMVEVYLNKYIRKNNSSCVLGTDIQLTNHVHSPTICQEIETST